MQSGLAAGQESRGRAACGESCRGTLWCLHGAVGEAADWSGFSPGGLAVRAVDLWRFLACRAMPMPDFGAALNAEAAAWAGPRVLLGYSMGGRLALHSLLDGGGAPWAAAVIVSAHPGLEDEAERAARRESDVEWGALALRDWEGFLAAWQAQPVLGGPACFERMRLAVRKREVARSFIDWSLGAQEPLWRRLGEIKVPVLWVSGEQDAKFSMLARRAVGLLPRGEWWQAPGAGHRVPWEAPRPFADRVAEFLERAAA